MNPPTTFVPKQCPPPGPDTYDAVAGTLTQDVARYVLALPSVPPITSSSIVHDNACGTGAVTALIASSTSDKIQRPSKIYATDIATPFVDAVKAKAKQQGWAGFVEPATMDAMNLDGFGDDMFTHSISNFGIQGLMDAGKGVKEIYRTVKPHEQGGVAIITTWQAVPHASALLAAKQATRGSDAIFYNQLNEERWTSEWLEAQLREGGFSKENVDIVERVVYSPIKDLREWCGLVWASLGKPKEGWTKRDEERWDEAVNVMLEEMKKKDNVEVREDGGAVLKLAAYVAIMKK